MIFTDKILMEGISRNGSWSQKQLEVLGVECYGSWPAHKGWRRELNGKEMPDAIVKEFLTLKDKHLKPKPLEQPALFKCTK